MVISQKQNVVNEIDAFVTNDYYSLLVEWNKQNGDGDVSSLMAGDYKITDLIRVALQSIDLLRKSLENPDWFSMPFNYTVLDYGQYNLIQIIQGLRNAFMSHSYANAVPFLNCLICYEKSLGIWTPARNIDIGIRESLLADLEARMQTIQKQTEEHSIKVNTLIQDLKEQKDQIDEFFSEKTQEANVLSSNTQSSNTLLAEIKGTQGNINTINDSINDINTKCKNLLQTLTDMHEEAATLQKELEKKSAEIEDSRQSLDEAIQTEKESVKKVYDEVNEHSDKIKELMSYISDGTLAHSFNKRKKDVTKTSFIWLGLGVFASIAIVVIILYLFASSNIDQQNIWPDILVKSMKTFPIACMVVYFFKQYAKERSLTEEYAFREAVAITLKAYLDQLEGEKDDHKRDLLINTVEKLYTKPSFSIKEESNVKIKSKDIVVLADKLLETTKILKQ